MGQDAGKSLDDFSTALGRQSRMILDNLGIIMDQEKAYSMYADTLGKSVAALTEEEKERAFVAAALELGSKKAEELGGVVEDTTTRTLQMNTAWADFQVEFGKVLTSAEEGVGVFNSLTTAIGWLKDGAVAWQGVFGESIPIMQDHWTEIARGQFALAKLTGENQIAIDVTKELGQAHTGALQKGIAATTNSFEEYQTVAMEVTKGMPLLAQGLNITEGS